jgi:hypothetical protein
MKRIYLFIFVFLLAVSLVFAANAEAVAQNSGQAAAGAASETGQGDDSGSGSTNGSGEPILYEHEVAVQTSNQGEASQLRIETGSEFGSTLKSGDSEAKTSMKMTQENENGQTKNFAELSNGMKAEIKVMPDTASEKALEALGAKCEENGCSIELKEVGKGEQVKAAYEVQAKKQVKVLGLFRSKMKTQAQVDAETGEVIKTRNAWWGFLASKK